jgi:opacity protein-like surface antigen
MVAALIALAVLAAGNAFAQMPELKLSAGAGGYFTSDFGGGGEGSVYPYHEAYKTPYAGGGGFVFFDATFVELSLGFFAASGDFKYYVDYKVVTERDISYTGLDISLLGKYPFALGEHVTLFPLLGMTYRHFTSVKINLPSTYKLPSKPGDLSALWFKLGGGVDYSFTEHIYARLGVLYGIRLKNKWEKDLVNYLKATYDGNGETLLGHGLDVKLAVGYRF